MDQAVGARSVSVRRRRFYENQSKRLAACAASSSFNCQSYRHRARTALEVFGRRCWSEENPGTQFGELHKKEKDLTNNFRTLLLNPFQDRSAKPLDQRLHCQILT